MAKEPKLYSRLPGRGTSIVHYVSLYQGPDHLLQVSSTGYSENYKRFYFRDIQSITFQKTHWGKILNGIWIFFAAIFTLPTFGMDGGSAIVMWIAAGIFLLLLALNLFAGPTSACSIRTAVQTERLPSLKRIKATRKMLNRIKPLILAVQGQLTAEDLARQMQQPSPHASHGLEAPPVIQPPADDPPIISPGHGAGTA